MRHLTLRVAWHDRAWDGAVCNHPSDNAFCLALDRVRESRDDAYEDGIAGASGPTSTETGCLPAAPRPAPFMNEREWTRVIQHPYQEIKKAQETHGHLLPTPVKVPPYTTFCIPFAWMTIRSQEEIAERLPAPAPRGSRGAISHELGLRAAPAGGAAGDVLRRPDSDRVPRLLLHEGRPAHQRLDQPACGRRGTAHKGRPGAGARHRGLQSFVPDVGPARPSLDPPGRFGRLPSPVPRVPRPNGRP